MTVQIPTTEQVREPKSTYTPTTDEVETAFHEFAAKLETDCPGSYEAAPEFADWVEAMHGFRRWLVEHDRQVAEKAWDEGKRTEELAWEHVLNGHPVAEGEFCDECEVKNPYWEGGA